MAPKIVRFSLALGTCLVATIGVLTAAAPRAADARQEGMSQGMGKGMTEKDMVSVTGCVRKGIEANGYYLTADDGKVWELTGKTVKVDKLVGTSVTLFGRQIHRSKTIEGKMETDETKEAAGKPYADLEAARVKVVSQSCGG